MWRRTEPAVVPAIGAFLTYSSPLRRLLGRMLAAPSP